MTLCLGRTRLKHSLVVVDSVFLSVTTHEIVIDDDDDDDGSFESSIMRNFVLVQVVRSSEMVLPLKRDMTGSGRSIRQELLNR